MVFGRLWSGYNAMLEKNPLFTKALTSFTGFTLGDILAQKFVTPDEEKGYDLARTLRLGECYWPARTRENVPARERAASSRS